MNSGITIFRKHASVKALLGFAVAIGIIAFSAISFLSSPLAARASSSVFSDGFGTGDTVNDISGWEEKGSDSDSSTQAKKPTVSGNDSASPDGGRFAKIGKYNPAHGPGGDGFICRSVNASGLTNLVLKYYWRGDSDAEGSGGSQDYGKVEYRTGGSCESSDNTWTNIVTHDLSVDTWSSLQSVALPSALDGETFFLRFRGDVTADDEDFRVDGVSLEGDEFPGGLIVEKVFVDDLGETALAENFSFTINDGTPVSFEADGSNEFVLTPGAYTVSEVAAPGYTTTYSEGCTLGVTTQATTTCTITNTELPGTLVVKKVLINDNGGEKIISEFTFSISGDATPNQLPATEEGATTTIPAGAQYEVVENEAVSWAALYDVSYSADCSGTVQGGETKYCTVTNDDIDQGGGQGGDGDGGDDQCVVTQTVVSDSTTQQNNADSIVLSFIHTAIHTAWTAAIDGASWIWGEEPPADTVNDYTETFTKTFTITGEPVGGTLEIAADNSYSVVLNGNALCDDQLEQNFNLATQDTCVVGASDLVQGVNTIEFTVKNWAQSGGTGTSNPAGLLYKLSYDEDTCTDPNPEVPQCEIDVELLKNGGFENPLVIDGAKWDIFASGTTGLEWLVSWFGGSATFGPDNRPTIANIELQQSGLSGWLSSEGNQWTELDADWNGHAAGPNGEPGAVSISQTIATEIGATYTFAFDFSPRPGTAAAQNVVEVLANSDVLGSVGPLATGGNQTEWTTHSFSFVATTTSTTITLHDAGTPNDSLGTFVDNASLVCSAEPVVAAPYCGDGIVNQDWEACDGGNSCTQWCQVSSDQCTEDVYAHVVVTAVSNTGAGDSTNNIYLGSNSNPLTSGTWFPVKIGGTVITDPDINGYEDVPGVAVQRKDDGIEVRVYGSLPKKGGQEHVEGYLEFSQGGALTQINATGQNKLEKPFDGKKKINPGQDEVWIDSGLSHFWMTVTGADDSYTTTYEMPSCGPHYSTVTLCKVDGNMQALQGWTLLLENQEEAVDSFSVPSNLPTGADSIALASNTPYVALVNGTWNNQGGANSVDAEYSTTDGWTTQMDGYTGYGVGILELEINQTDGAWGAYNSLHSYAQGFTLGADGSANFRIFDGDTGTHTVNEGWYGDNSGSLNVSIVKGYAGITSENGCVVFSDVPYGTYDLSEMLQDGWVASSTNPTVAVVDSPEQTFTLVNDLDVPDPTTATIHATKIVCEDESYLPNWGAGDADPVTSTTATDFLASVNTDESDHCWLEPDWSFQWVTNSESSSNPGDNLLTPADSPWTTFGLTNESGVVTTAIPVDDRVWVREILQDGYIPFTGQNTDQDVSAELYCNTDALNYDNWDWIDPVVAGETYYCVAFNALTDNGGGGNPDDVCDEGYTFDSQTEQCVPNGGGGGPSVDLCENLEGSQTQIPEGYQLKDEDQCVPIDDDSEEEGGGSGDGGGGGGNGPISTLGFFGGGGQVLGASTETPGESCGLYLDKFIRFNRNNDPDQVRKLQMFLNKLLGLNLPITGFYGPLTYEAVLQFQTQYASTILTPWGLTSPTGIVYITTLRQINMLECPQLDLGIPPLTPWAN